MKEIRRICLPYCVQKTADGLYEVLSRDYQPLGPRMKLSMTPKRAASISWEGSEKTDQIWLYNDGTIPTSNKEHMAAYFDRLGKLMKLKGEPVK